MPLPKPGESESRQEFVSRCMGNPVMRQEYQNQDQRLAVCYNLYDRPSNKTEYADTEIGDTPLEILEDDLDD